MPTRAPARLIAAAAAVLLLATGCSEPTDDATSSASASASPDGESTSASPSASPPASPSTSPSASPSESSTSPSPTEPDSGQTVAPPTGGLRGRLLLAEELPGFNDQFRWRSGATSAEDPSRSFGTCQRFAVTSIGAERAVVRRYRPVGPDATRDAAGELVAVFPDDATARRAYEVLTSWRATCKEQLRRFARSEVGALTQVPVPEVPGARAAWYLVTYGPVPGDPQAGFFDAQGMVLSGRRIAMLSLVLAGQDYNYGAGQEPMVAALQRAAQKLG